MTTAANSYILWLTLAVLGLPLMASLSCFSIKQKVGWLAPLLSSILLLIASILASILFFQIGSEYEVSFSWVWFNLNQKEIALSILLDSKASIMMLIVTIVSFLVHVYSIGYMAEDYHQARYFGMLAFFTFAMIGLVMGSNLLIIFIFWELVGVSSYRLIAHDQEKETAIKAATKAFLLNKIGDIGFLIGLIILWSWSGTLEVADPNLISIPPFWLATAGVCMFIGVISKSAQFPLFNWLPDAMEGPTPVSALIHAATMVAAGAYLLVRIAILFTEDVLILIAITGAITTLAGAVGALFQFDIKKILAYSTISQLGLIVMAMGGGAVQGGYFHLLHHAFFKAGLFLGAGAIIHALHQVNQQSNMDVQDIRNMGGLRKKLPITFISFMICAAALSGIPFTSGYVSKEFILTQMTMWAGNEFSWRWIVMSCTWAVTFLTPIYTFRLVWFIFYRKPQHEHNIEEVPIIMRIPLIVLAVGSLAMLSSLSPFHISSVINVLQQSYPSTNTIISFVSIALILISSAAAFYIYKNQDAKNQKLVTPQYYLDAVSNYFSLLTLKLSEATRWFDKRIDFLIHGISYFQITVAHITGWADRYLVDGVVDGIAYSAKGVGAVTRSLANGKIQSYLLWAMAGLVIFIVWILY
ncbi:MAG: NADH-quinone oxidoreductase subunit L [Cyclobacteriaceae bacterium]|nr:NADH-quinone oxidoreductase subunit L [Cyclobacteriaceae bacterium]